MKKNLTKITIGIFILTVLISSCQIEKRHYTSGYNVKWFGSKSNSVVKNTESKSKTASQINPVKVIEPSRQNFSSQNEYSLTKAREINKQSLNSNKLTASNDNSSPVVFDNTVNNDKTENITSEATALNTAKALLMEKSGSVGSSNGVGDNSSLLRFVIAVLGAIIFFALAVSIGGVVGVLCWIVGLICFVLAIIYFFRWLGTV
jgi:hypothetical protein